MKTLHIIIALNIGGAELMLKRLVLNAQRHSPQDQHSVISLTSIGEVGQQLQDGGIKVHVLGMTSPLNGPRTFWRLFRVIRASRCDVVQTWMYHADLLGGIVARLAGCRAVIWGIRGTHLPRNSSWTTQRVRWVCARLSRWVPSLIVCAAEASRQLHVDLGYAPEKMAVIPNGYELDQLVAAPGARAHLRQEWGVADNELVVGYLGRFDPIKDPENFVRAAGLVASENPLAYFLLVGRNQDAHNKALAEWIAATGFAERFIRLGERADVPEVLSAMDVFCLSSRTEGFPNVVAEAMAMGIPCVVTNVGDAATLLGGTGRVVPAEDPQALAGEMLAVLALDGQERSEMGAQGRIRVHSEYSIQKARERFEAVYRHILNRVER